MKNEPDGKAFLGRTESHAAPGSRHFPTAMADYRALPSRSCVKLSGAAQNAAL